MNGQTMSYGGAGSDEFNAGYELRQIQEKEEQTSADVKLHKALAIAFAREAMTGEQLGQFIAIYRGLK
jgi:asparagine synthetase B (glutamine-hydrolysing)